MKHDFYGFLNKEKMGFVDGIVAKYGLKKKVYTNEQFCMIKDVNQYSEEAEELRKVEGLTEDINTVEDWRG